MKLMNNGALSIPDVYFIMYLSNNQISTVFGYKYKIS